MAMEKKRGRPGAGPPPWWPGEQLQLFPTPVSHTPPCGCSVDALEAAVAPAKRSRPQRPGRRSRAA